MENNKQYKIYEILSVASNWAMDPENKDNILELEKIKEELIIRSYMPIGMKELCLRKAIIDMRTTEEEELPYGISVKYEIALLFDCLLAYVVNIDPEIDSIFKDRDFYDLLWISGIAERILEYCEEDYKLLVNMANRMISFDNFKELIKNIQLTSPEQIERLTNEFKNFVVELNPESLKHLDSIMAYNNPIINNIKKEVDNIAYNTISEKIEEESEN